MQNRFSMWLVVGLLFLAPAAARAQFVEVPPTPFTAFLSHPRYEEGGFFVGFDFVYLRQENVIGAQTVAKRGFVDMDGSITGTPGQYVGQEIEALNTNQLQGRPSYQPGFNIAMGWRFEDGLVVQANWLHLTEGRFNAAATLVPPGYQVGNNLQNTFLFSPVYNFPIYYGGNVRNVTAGNDGATFGIWNAASEMTIEWLSRFEMVDIGARIPIWQTDGYRSYGMIGPRAIIMWERFKWRTIDADVTGQASPSTTADYYNVISNRLYGVFAGCGQEWFLGSTPLGGFSFTLDLEGALYLDFVKERARYQLEDRSTAATHKRNTYTLVPGLQGKIGFWWYPWEAITVHLGWDALVLFNTVTSRQPIDFNFSSLDPEYNQGTIRYLHGLEIGIGLVF